jgi:hypothetical protein
VRISAQPEAASASPIVIAIASFLFMMHSRFIEGYVMRAGRMGLRTLADSTLDSAGR